MFENVLSNLLKKLVFGVEKRMNTVSFVDVETIDKILSQATASAYLKVSGI
jgi:hypothetical protein